MVVPARATSCQTRLFAAASDFAAKLAGALQIAAQDVKVQVEFNPERVTAYRQIGYAKHQLTKEQFRDNSVAAVSRSRCESEGMSMTASYRSTAYLAR